MEISPNKQKNESYCLTYLSKSLTSSEKMVVLLIDYLIRYIYITKRLDYRSSTLIGGASNERSLAKTVLAFMICSAVGNFCEIVKLLPVCKIKGNDMAPVVKTLLI